MKYSIVFLLVITINQFFAQKESKLKLTHFSISRDELRIIDEYKSIYFLMDYAKDKSLIDPNAATYYPFQPYDPNLKLNHRKNISRGNAWNLLVGFTPKKENRELNFGLSYTTIQQTSYRSSSFTSYPTDTLTVTGTNGITETQFVRITENEQHLYSFSTKNLFGSAEYLIKSKNDCINGYAGIGIKLGVSLSARMTDHQQIDSYMYIQDTSNNITYSSYYPYFNEENQDFTPLINFAFIDTKTILYFSPYLPFGFRIKLSQKDNWLSHFNLDLRSSIGMETQFMKRATLMVRPTFSFGAAVYYSL